MKKNLYNKNTNYMQVGDILSLKAFDLGKDSNDNDYLSLEGKGGEMLRVYTYPIKFEEENLPLVVSVKVAKIAKIDCFKRVSLRLDVAKLFKEHYQLNVKYRFTVEDRRIDPNTRNLYYIIADDFAEHRFYTNDDLWEIGEECVLLSKEFNEKGFLVFERVATESQLEEIEVVAPMYAEEAIDERYILDIEGEGTTLELKTSIAFPPGGNGEANIDKQLDNIIRVICAFMNTEGGKLYIGVHDTKKCVEGIADDYEHLNDSTEDENQYNKNHDGYELKIRNTIDRKCTSVVNSLIEFSFCQQGNREYCVITVTKAKRPVWFNRTQLWVRQGCRNKQLKDDEITLFVADYITISAREKLEYDGVDITHQDDIERMKTLRSMIYTLQNDVVPPKPSLDKIDYWINWLEDGSFKRTREKADDANYCIQVPVLRNITSPRILFCYKSGHVNCMELDEFRRGATMNNIETQKPWNTDNGVPINILIASPADLLFGFSVDYNKNEHVKFHILTDFTPTQRAKNQGVRFIPENNTMIKFCIVDSSYRKQLEHLQRTKQQRSQTAGEPIDSSTFQSEINILKKLLKRNTTIESGETK